MADAATVLLVMSCRVFLAGKVDELFDVVGAGVVGDIVIIAKTLRAVFQRDGAY